MLRKHAPQFMFSAAGEGRATIILILREDIEAQRGDILCPGSHNKEMAKTGFEPILLSE